MKTAKYQTARVYWSMGQALLPEHFRAQESSLHEEFILRMSLLPMPFSGVARLQWNSFQFLKGIVSIEELTLVLPDDGALLDIPGNTAPATFDLKTAGASRTPLYLHLKGPEGEQHVLSDAADDQRNGIDVVERRVHHITLSSDRVAPDATHTITFKLAEFEKTPDGTWAPVEGFLPQLVRLSGSPFFAPTLKRIRHLAETLKEQLLEEIQVSYLGGESLMSARECLKGLYRFGVLLANMEKDYQPHPYEVFRALHELYIDVCMLRGANPDPKVALYQHAALGECFQALLKELEFHILRSRTATPYIPFTRKEGQHVCALPEAARKARRVYWLMQKPSVGARMDLDGLKLASEARLSVVHQLALRGIPFQRIENPPFHHPFSSEVEFYALAAGEEWDHAVREGKLAFFHRPKMESVRTFLYWRDE